MRIEIHNPKQIMTDAGTLQKQTQDLESARQSIENILNDLNSYWSQDQEDAHAFSEQLNQDVTDLFTIENCNRKFATAIETYAEAIDKASNTGVSS